LVEENTQTETVSDWAGHSWSSWVW